MRFSVLAIALSSLALASTQPSPDLASRFAGARLPIALTNGALTGDGAARLRDAFREAPFVLVGEDHGLAEIPAFCAALFSELVPLGFHDVVVETGPEAGRRLTRVLHAPDPLAALQRWTVDYPFSLAFYNLRQEFAFLEEARRAAGPSLRVTGVDQELMGAGRLLLDVVRGDDAGLQALRREERMAFETASRTGSPADLFMMQAPVPPLLALRERLRSARRAEEAAAIDALLDSRRIYELQSASRLRNNTERAQLMRRYYRAQVAGVPPKALFKFGAMHVMKGLNTLNSRELGNHIAETADGLGRPSLHVLVMAVQGQQRRFAGVGRPYVTAPIDQVGPGQSDFPFAKPLFERALAEDGWSLFDFRMLREWADRDPSIDWRLTRLLFGFDFAVIIPRGTPSDEIR